MTKQRKIALGLGALAGLGTLVYFAASPKKAGAEELGPEEAEALPDGLPPGAQAAPPGEPVITVQPGDIDGTSIPDEPEEVVLEETPPEVLEAEEAEAQDAAEADAAEAEAEEEAEAAQSLPAPVQTAVDAGTAVLQSLPPEIQSALPTPEQLQAQAEAATATVQRTAPQVAQQATAVAEAAAEEAEAVAEADPEDVPDDTVALAQLMLEEEGRSNWKRRIPELADWQEARGLVADQKFGPKSAEAMAEEIGTVPIVRFWSHWDKAKSVKDYRDALLAMASESSPGRAAQLRSSAMRETGQAYDRNPGPVSPTFTLELA